MSARPSSLAASAHMAQSAASVGSQPPCFLPEARPLRATHLWAVHQCSCARHHGRWTRACRLMASPCRCRCKRRSHRPLQQCRRRSTRLRRMSTVAWVHVHVRACMHALMHRQRRNFVGSCGGQYIRPADTPRAPSPRQYLLAVVGAVVIFVRGAKHLAD